MATLEKLGRALNALKLLHTKSDVSRPGKKGEKVTLCLTITDLICSSNVKNADNFVTLLHFAISLLLELLDQSDSNARLVIDESINKIIRAVSDNPNFVVKVLTALLTVMKKNNNARTIKACIWRFGELAHLIKPQKARLYVQYLVPVFVKISEMKDDMVLETLGNAFPNILENIGSYTSDSDIKVLLRAFLRNLYSDSAAIRRSGVQSIIAICLYSRKPHMFFCHFLRVILDALLRIQKDHIVEDGPILGLFTCIRHILAHISGKTQEKSRDNLLFATSTVNVEHYLQIYELCLHYSMARDQNISAAALETLYQLLLSASVQLKQRLTTKGGLSKSTTGRTNIYGSMLSLGAFSEVPITSDELDNTSIFHTNSVSELSMCTLRSDCNVDEWNFDKQSINTYTPSISTSFQNLNLSSFGESDNEDSVSDLNPAISSGNRTLSVDNIHQCRARRSKLISRIDTLSMSEQMVSSIASVTSLEFLPVELEIGNMVDANIIPLDYCARHLVSSFLLECHSSFKVRVSVISLALNCLSQVFNMYPDAAFLTVEKNLTDYNGIANITEVIILYCNNEDQQVRGLACVVLGNFIKSAIIRSEFGVRKWLPSTIDSNFLDRLVSLLIKSSEDESSVCIRHALSAISMCLNLLLKSADNDLGICMYRSLFRLKENPYWLIKVKLIEVICDTSYKYIFFIDGNTKEQDRALNKIIIPFLEDSDNRIRHAAAESLIKYVSNAYYPIDKNTPDLCTSYILESNKRLILQLTCQNTGNYFPFPRDLAADFKYSATVNANLSRIIYLLNQTLMRSWSKYFITGCSEALHLLAIKYPPIIYTNAWQCFYAADQSHTNKTCGLFDLVISFLTCNPIMLDLNTHAYLLQVATKLFNALCMLIVRVSETPFSPITEKLPWHFITYKKVSALAELLLQHMMRLTNIFDQVIQNIPMASTPSLLSSALKSPTSSLERSASWRSFDSLAAKSKSSDLKPNDEKRVPFGHYTYIPLYVKLRDSLQSAYNNYKVTLRTKPDDKFVYFLKVLLECFSSMMEFMTFSESDRISEELLHCIQNFLPLAPVHSIHCVVQLLKNVFGTNILSQYLEKQPKQDVSYNPHGGNKLEEYPSFYSSCFEFHHRQMLQFFMEATEHQDRNVTNKNWEEYEKDRYQTFGKYLKRNARINILPSYIKLFEPMVIQSLKHYTITGDTALQAEVLSLLTELVQLKVNFCLLDPEQEYITFVLSQFQYIEEDQFRNVEVLIPKLFNFLVQLTNEKHSKPVMFVPKIIQLCDCLIASEQPPSISIAALSPVIEHVFLSKNPHPANSNEIKELETQRDVLFGMLLRLIHHSQALQLLRMIIVKSDNDNKRIKRSAQIIDTFFDALLKSKVEPVSEYSFTYILKLLLAFHSDAYTNEQLLCVILDIYCNKAESPAKWLMCMLPCLLILFSKIDEDMLLACMQKMSIHPFIINEFGDGITPDPLNVSQPCPVQVVPALAFNRLFLLVIYTTVEYICCTKYDLDQDDISGVSFMKKLLSCLLSFIHYVHISGRFLLIRSNMTEIYQSEAKDLNGYIHRINNLVNELSVTEPTLALRWYSILINVMNNTAKSSEHISEPNSDFVAHRCIGLSKLIEQATENDFFGNMVLKHGIFLLRCLHMAENVTNGNDLRIFLNDELEQIIKSIEEFPVQELLASIQNSVEASRLFVHIIADKVSYLLNKGNFIIYEMLQCLEYVNPELNGQILMLCAEPQLLSNIFLPVSKLATTFAIRNAEYLLTLENQSEIGKYLELHDLQSLLLKLSQSENCSRNLLALVSKIAIHFYQYQSSDLGDNNSKTDFILTANMNKQCFINQVKHKCCSDNCSEIVCAELLNKLPLEDIFTIMRCESFNDSILTHCLTIGTRVTLQNWKDNFVEKPDAELSSLYLAARSSIVRHIRHFKTLLPRNHQVYMPVGRDKSVKEEHYTTHINSIFSNPEFMESALKIIHAVTEYVNSINQLSCNIDIQFVISDDLLPDLISFAVLCSEIAHWLVICTESCWSVSRVLTALKCSLCILTLDNVSNLITITQMGSLVSMLYLMIETVYNEPITLVPNSVLQEKSTNLDVLNIAHSCHQIGTLIDFVTSKCSSISYESSCLKRVLRKFTVVLSRYPLIYSCARVPKEAWKHLSANDINVENNFITVNPLKDELLQDYDILKQFIKRIMFIGWRTRQQFEETWVSLLSVLSSSSSPDAPTEEILAMAQTNSIAVNGITSLLIQTILHPIPGNTAGSAILNISRNKNPNISNYEWGLKLQNINEELERKIINQNEPLKSLHSNIGVNIERLHNYNKYDYNQISVEYLSKVEQWKLRSDLWTTENVTGLESVYLQRELAMRNIGVDLQSCIHFLLDFYSQWFAKQGRQPLCMSLEVVKSMIIISDLFTEQMQFSWLLTTCMMLHQNHPSEDDILHQYIILGICKSAAVSIPLDSEMKENVIKALISGLSSNYYPMQISSLHALLYLLECIFKKTELNRTDIITADFEEQILMIAVNYAAGNLDDELPERCSEHAVLPIIAISFYLLENKACGASEDQIFENLLLLTTRVCKLQLYMLHMALMQGLYNLVLLRNDIVIGKHKLLPLIRESLSLTECTSQVAISNLQLLLALMYVSEFEVIPSTENANTPFDTDKLIVKMEKVAIFFERIKKGYRVEVEIICGFLATLLNDFFPPSKVLNKTINEFLSPQQPYPDLMCDVVFKMFQHTIQQDQLPLLQEWVLTLLNNFTQGYSFPVATFCLTCFFISASTNEWLIALFPKLKSRLGLLEEEDKRLLCIAAKQFYSELTDSQKDVFISTFKSAAKQQPASPFTAILSLF